MNCNPNYGCGILNNCELLNDQYLCVHDPILLLTPYTKIVFIIIPLFVGVGILGGLGGGMVKRPIFDLLLNYPNSIANMATNSVVLGSQALNAIILLFEKHPDHPQLPIINFEIAIIFNMAIPPFWIIGYKLSTLFPTLIIYLFQLIFLILAVPYLWKETSNQKKLEEDKRLNKIHIVEEIKSDNQIAQELTLSESQLTLYRRFYRINHSIFQWKNLILIFCVFLMNQLIIFLRSTRYHDSIIGLDKCSLKNELTIVLLIIINLIMSIIIYYIKRKEELQKDQVFYRCEDRYFTQKKIFFKFFIGGCLAGFTAGLLSSIGAGILMVSFMLSAGIIAREAAATAGLCNFMISLNSLILIVEQDSLTDEQELIFILLGVIGVILFTKPCYIIMSSKKIGYIALIVDILQELLNIIAIICLIVIQEHLYGTQLMQINTLC